MEKIYKKIAELPVGAIATTVGAVTISNVWSGFGYVWIRNLTMICGGVIWILGLLKIIGHFKTFKGEDVSQVKKPLYAIDYSDFFTMTDNVEFAYQGSGGLENGI